MNQHPHNVPAFANTDGQTFCTDGLSKREYTAIHLLAGMLADPGVFDPDKASDSAIKFTDTLLAKLDATKPQLPPDICTKCEGDKNAGLCTCLPF